MSSSFGSNASSHLEVFYAEGIPQQLPRLLVRKVCVDEVLGIGEEVVLFVFVYGCLRGGAGGCCCRRDGVVALWVQVTS